MDLNLLARQINDFTEKTVLHQTFDWLGIEPTSILPDGTRVICDQTGNIVFAHYSSGATVMRFNEFVVCSNQFGEHWFCDRHYSWFRID
jgi:hypothetical protein